jgi:hypothetical protein
MKGDESTPPFSPLGEGLPVHERREERGDTTRGLPPDASRGLREPDDTIPDETETALLVESTADALILAALNEESQKRLWLRTIIPLLQLRSHDSDPSGRVQLAYDLMHIAACERASRLLRSDLSVERG